MSVNGTSEQGPQPSVLVGDTAFPRMPLRDYFAAKALPLIWAVVPDDEPLLDIAASAYRMADAMLKARQS